MTDDRPLAQKCIGIGTAVAIPPNNNDGHVYCRA